MAAAAGVCAALALLGCAGAAPDAVAGGGPAGAGGAEAAGGSTSPLRIAAAASLEPAMPALLAAFSEVHPEVTVAPVTFDGSAVLAAQLRAGAPTEVFIAADQRTLAELDAAGLLAGEPVPVAQNHLEIAVAPGNPLGVRELADLAKLDAALVVMCAPEVPCGRAASELFARAGIALGDDVTPASLEQNVSAVLQKVQAGEADAGLVYRTDIVRAGGAVTGVAIADAAAVPTTVTAAVTANAAGADAATAGTARAARAFVAFLSSDAARVVLRTAGFGELPELPEQPGDSP